MAKFTRNSSGQKVYSSKKSSTSSSSSKTNSGSSQTTLSNADVKALGALTGKNLSDSSINEARNRANSSGISNANDPIDASKMTNVTAVNPPEMPKVDPANGVVVAGNVANGLNPDGTTKVTEGNTDVANPVQAQLDNYLKAMSETPSAEDIYNSMPEKRAFENAAREEQKYASQINTIVAKSQADQLSTIGQGRGIPEAIIGGQQAQIAREAAIQALPLQALLANAQGNKELAQQQLDTMFKMKMQDAQAQYDYKVKYLGMVYEIADKNEQRKLNEIYRKEDQAFELLKGDIAWERQQLSDSMDFKRQIGLLDYKAGLDAKTTSQEERVASENGYNQAVTGQEEVQKLLNNKKGLGIITSNLGGIGRFFSSIGNLGKGTRGDEQGGLGAKNDALASARYVLENLTLDKLGKLETPLTPVSNSDVDIVRKASGVLAGYADYKVKGEMSTFKGFKGDLDSVTKAIEDLDTVFKKQIDKNNALIGLTAEEIAALK